MPKANPAVVFVPDDQPNLQYWQALGAQRCALRGYELVALVTCWADVEMMLESRQATVAIAVTREHLPKDWVPPFEFLAEGPSQVTPPTARQVRRVPRRT